MRSHDIILAMRAGQDPERLAQLRRNQLERVVATVLVVAACGLVLLGTCS